MRIKDKTTGRFVSGNLTKNCAICGISIKVKLCRFKRTKYCSDKCRFVSMVGRKQDEKWIANRIKGMTGKKRSLDFKKRCSELHIGSRNPQWRGGVSSERILLSNSPEYKQWRKNVFIRDNYICVKCGDRGKELNADHIIPWWMDTQKRLNIDNGQTLCVLCHREKTSREMKMGWVNQFSSSIMYASYKCWK